MSEIQIGSYIIRELPGGLLQIDNPDKQVSVSHMPGHYVEAVGYMQMNTVDNSIKIAKSNNPEIHGRKIRVLSNRDIKKGDFVIAATGSKKGYGWIRYVTKVNTKKESGVSAETFTDDGKISSVAPLPRAFAKNYMVVEFMEEDLVS